MQPFLFPTHGVTIEAESLEEAQAKLKEQFPSTSETTET